MTNEVLERKIDELASEFGAAELEDAVLMLAYRRHAGIGKLKKQTEGQRSPIDWELMRQATIVTFRERLFQTIDGASEHVREQEAEYQALQEEMKAELTEQVWREPMLRPAEAAAAVGWENGYLAKLRSYRRRSWLVGFLADGAYHYLAFQFSPEHGDVFPEVRTINELLDAARDPWGVALWWISSHARIGTRPADLIGTDRVTDLLQVAEGELEPVG